MITEYSARNESKVVKEAAPATEPVVEQMIDTTVETETETVVEEISEPEEKTAGEEEAAKEAEVKEELVHGEPEEDAIGEEVLEETVAEAPTEEERISESVMEEATDVQPEAEPEETMKEETAKTEHRESRFSRITKIISSPKREEKRHEKAKDFQPIKKRVDEDEDLVNGDVNPYTGHEYQSNSVRMHPKRIGYVQVYDRKEHKWTDMTEWAFLGFEERKKATLGKDYEPPIYLD